MTQLDYPKTIIEFQKKFSKEEDCISYLYHSRWTKGFVCPVCKDTEFYYISSRRAYQCKSNKHQTYLTANTVMHGTRQSLLKWLWSAYLLTTETVGISAKQLQRQLGIKRYETAYNMLQKLRSAMVNPEREKIGSLVEIDDTYVGGTTTGGKRGRGTQKAVVIVAVEKKGKKSGRIRLRHLPDISERHVIRFIKENIKKGSTIITDSYKSYGNIKRYGYKHRTVLSGADKKSLPLAHLAISNLKSWIKGIFHGVSKKHLQTYLNEYVFRFNRRFYPMAGFRTILGLSSQVDFPTYKELYSGEWKHPNPKNQKDA